MSERACASVADPRLKLGVAAVALAVALSAPRGAAPLALAGCAAAALLAAAPRRIPWRGLIVAWCLGAAAAALRALLAPGPALVTVAVCGRPLPLSGAGVAQGLVIVARVLASTLVAACLTCTTPFPQLVAALTWARVPAPALDLLLLAHRHRHALGDALESVRCAQSMRLGYVGLRRSVASAGVLVGAGACRAIDQAGATAEAMQLRGDRGAAALSLPERCPGADARLVAGAAAAVLASVALTWGTRW